MCGFSLGEGSCSTRVVTHLGVKLWRNTIGFSYRIKTISQFLVQINRESCIEENETNISGPKVEQHGNTTIDQASEA